MRPSQDEALPGGLVNQTTGISIKKGIILRAHFCASHALKDYDGDCSKLHGHTWKVEITFLYQDKNTSLSRFDHYGVLASDELSADCMAADFRVLKNIVNKCLPDHRHLNDFFGSDNVTAEYLSNVLFNSIRKSIDNVFNGRVWLSKLVIYESDDAAAFVEVRNGRV